MAANTYRRVWLSCLRRGVCAWTDQASGWICSESGQWEAGWMSCRQSSRQWNLKEWTARA